MEKARPSSELLRKIKDSVNLIDVISENVVLRKVGSNYMGLCPFHSERSPSFSVSETKQLYHCYGCKKGGDLISFVMELQGLSFIEALEDLADRAKLPLPENFRGSSQTPDGVQAAEKRALLYRVNRFSAAFFHQTLSQEPQQSAYLQHRGVDAELIRSFYLGSSTNSWDSLAQFLTAKKAPLSVAVELGLIRASTKGSGYFDLFRNRAIFPIVNLRGKVVGFGGRSLGDETPKYLNSPESLLFQKSKQVFGLYQAQKYIREADEVILVEGYFDVLVMVSAGFRNVVATCGTALTREHIQTLSRLASRIVILFDGDAAGHAATLRAMEMGLAQGLIFYGAQLPEGMDPDDALLRQVQGHLPGEAREKAREEARKEMEALLSSAKPLLDEAMNQAFLAAQQGPEAQTQALKKVTGWLGQFTDPVGREMRMKLLEKTIGVPRTVIQQWVSVGGGQVQTQKEIYRVEPKPDSPERKKETAVALSRTDQILLMGLMMGGDQADKLMELSQQFPKGHDLSELFESPLARQFVDQAVREEGFLERLRQTPDVLSDLRLEPALRAVLTGAFVSSGAPCSNEELSQAMAKAMKRFWDKISKTMKKSIRDVGLNPGSVSQDQALKDYLDVQRKIKDFNRLYEQE